MSERRRIEFRGKIYDLRDNVYREWRYGSLVIINGRYFIFNDEYRTNIDPTTVGQYWRTVNGIDLFEGDIFEITSPVGNVYRWVVRYSEEKTAFCITKTNRLSSSFWHGIDIDEVPEPSWWDSYGGLVKLVGNIYDNPELLKDEQ